MVKLFKVIKGKLELVDYGIASMVEKYTKDGYIVEYIKKAGEPTKITKTWKGSTS